MGTVVLVNELLQVQSQQRECNTFISPSSKTNSGYNYDALTFLNGVTKQKQIKIFCKVHEQ